MEDTLVDSSTPIIKEVHVSSNSTSDDVDELVESNIPAMPSKSFEFSCAGYGFMVVSNKSSSSESFKFFVMIQQVISTASFSGCLEFISESGLPLAGIVVCHPRHPICPFPYL